MLRDCTERNVEVWHAIQRIYISCSSYHSLLIQTTIFGVKHSSPLLIAPIGVQGIVHADAELGTARAAARLGVPMIMSTASSRSIEDVGKANGNGHRWYQLYW